MQVVSLIVILGLTGNFINEMVMANLVPSQEIVGTISVVCHFELIEIELFVANT